MSQSIKKVTIGQCIYCGIIDDSLTDEHVIPFALGGPYILQKASCKKCAEITSLFERRVLRGPLSKYRCLKQFPSRTKYKEFVSEEEYTIRNKQGKLQTRKMHLNKVGIHLFLPEFKEPKYFIPNPKTKGIDIKRFCYFKAPAKKSNIDTDISEVKISQKFPTSDFLRFLCKIALGYTLLKHKKNKIEIYITNLILGKTGVEDWKYIGSPIKSSFAYDEAGLKLHQTESILWCEIKLFKDMPVTYKVVVGKLKI